jgi:hypothetical protein
MSYPGLMSLNAKMPCEALKHSGCVWVDLVDHPIYAY